MKTHETAIVVIPSTEVCEPIQRIREHHDRNAVRWMPHVTLLYPFWPGSELERARTILAEILESQAPFSVTLARFRAFRHGRRSTLWLDPEPAAPLTVLQQVLETAFPGCDDVSRHRDGFTPHLSVGQVSEAGREELLEQLQSQWDPRQFEVQDVCVISREGRAAFEVEARIPLSGTPPATRG